MADGYSVQAEFSIRDKMNATISKTAKNLESFGQMVNNAQANLNKFNAGNIDTVGSALNKATTSAKNAAQGFNVLNRDVRNVGGDIGKLNGLINKVDKLGDESKQTGREVGEIDDKANFRKLTSGTTNAEKHLNKLGRESKETRVQLSNIDDKFTLRKAINDTKRLDDSLEEVGRQARETSSKLKNVGSSSSNMGSVSNKATSAMQSGLSKASEKAHSLSSTIKGAAVGTVVFGSVNKATEVLSNSVQGAVERYDTLNRSTKVMEMLGNSTKASKAAVDKLAKGLEGLPISTDQAVGTLQQLVATGTGINKATDYTVAYSHALAASGATQEQVTSFMQQYQQVMAKGKPELEDWKIMTEAMAPALNKVAKEMLGSKASSMDLYEALKNGKVTMDDVNAKFVEMDKGAKGFAKAAKESSGGIASSFAVIQSRLNIVGATFIDKVDKMITETTKFEGISGMLGAFADKISAVNAKFKEMTPEQLAEKIKGLGLAFAGLSTAAMALPAVIDTVSGGFNKTKETVSEAGGAFNLFKEKVSGVKQGFSNAVSGITPFENALNGVKSKTSESANFIKEKFNNTVPEGVRTGFSKAGQTAKAGASSMGNVMKLGLKAVAPAVVVTTMLAGLGAAYQQYGDQINKFIETSKQKGPEIIQKLANGISEKLPGLVNSGVQMISKIIEGITANMPAIMQGAAKVINTMLTSLTENLPKLLEMGGKLITSIGQGLAENLPSIVQKGVELVAKFVTTIAENLPQIVSKGAEMLANLAQGIGQKLPEIAKTAVTTVGKFLASLVNSLPQIIEGGWKIIESLAKGIIEGIPKALGNAWNKIKNFFKTGNKELEDEEKQHNSRMNKEYLTNTNNVEKAMQDASKKKNSEQKKGNKQLIQNEAETVQKLATEGKKHASNAGSSSKAAADKQSSNTKRGNSDVIKSYDKMDDSTKKSMENMTKNVDVSSKKSTDAATKNAQNMSKNVAKAYKEMAVAVDESSKKMTKGMDSSFKKISDLVKSSTKNWMDRVKDATNKMSSDMKSGMNKMKSAVSSGASSITSRIKQLMNDCIRAVRSSGNGFYSAGSYIMAGLRNGINSGAGAIYSRVNTIANNIQRTLRKAMDIHSPSRVMAEIGGYISEGVAVGIDKKAYTAIDSTKALAKDIQSNFNADFTAQGKSLAQNTFELNNNDRTVNLGLNIGGYDFGQFTTQISNAQSQVAQLQQYNL